MQIVRTPNPSREDIDAVLGIIAAHSEEVQPGGNYQSIGFLLRAEDGTVAGGLTGYALYDWLFIQFLGVREELRGQGHGRALLNDAEAWARENGLVGMWLDTFEFQAKGLYEKLGFTVFGVIEDHPVGSRRYFMQRRFESEAPTA